MSEVQTWHRTETFDEYNYETCGRCGSVVETRYFRDEHEKFHAQIDALSEPSNSAVKDKIVTVDETHAKINLNDIP